MAAIPTPAHSLTGVTLSSGWLLTVKLSPGSGSTGGNFGVGYRATRGGQKAFVKAVDFVEALKSTDPLAELASLTSQANFERDALAFCGTKRMSRVVRLIRHEYYNPSGNPMQVVSCLIMEIGEGDLRAQLNGSVLP
jgi:eukaryotic-like serine/threonine-protein kinase